MEFGAPLIYGLAHDGSDDESTLFDGMLEIAIAADRAGIGYLWTQEHHMIALGQSPSALMTIVQLAQHVKARVGTAVVVLPYHNAIQIAGEIAQADNLTGGRLELGVGRGAYPYEFTKFGIPFEQSLPRFIETLDAVRELLTAEGETSFHGEFVNFDDVYVWPRPRQTPHPPIWVAAQTPRAVQDAGRRGYNVMTQLFIWDDGHLETILAAFREGQREGGHTGTRLAATRYAYLATDEADVEARLDELMDNWRIHAQLHDFSHTKNPRGIIRPVPQENEPDRDELRERLLIGTESHVRAKIEKYRDMGLDLLNLGVNFGLPKAQVIESFGRLAPLVAEYSETAKSVLTA